MAIKKLTIVIVFGLMGVLAIQCKDRERKIQPAWITKIGYINYLSFRHDSLFAIIREGNELQSIVIDKMNGVILDTLEVQELSIDRKQESRHEKFSRLNETKIDLYGCKGTKVPAETEIFQTKKCEYVICNNFKGYRIILQTSYRNIRTENNIVHSFIIQKEGSYVSNLPSELIYDFVSTSTSMYVLKKNQHQGYAIEKYLLDDLVGL